MSDETTADLLNQARDALRAGDVDWAAELFRSLLEEEPLHYEAHEGLVGSPGTELEFAL